MEKIIKIGEKEIRLSNNVAWTMEYRDQFGKDIVPTLLPVIASLVEGVSAVMNETGKSEITVTDISEAVQGRSMDILLPLFQVEFVDVIINVTWAMAKAADENIEPPKRWVRQFEDFPLDVILPEVGDMVLKGFVSSKNLTRLKKAGREVLQPSLSMTSSSQDSKED